MIKQIFILLSFLISYTSLAQTNADYFNGLYTGVEFANNYMFGGAQVDNIETIGDGNVNVIGGTTGWRRTYVNGFHFGVEIQLNKPFGKFENRENPDGTIVKYKIRPQSALQFNLGYAFGKTRKQLMFIYFAFNQTRFNIDIIRPSGNFFQTDFENFGRIGLGYAYAFSPRLSSRIMIGTSMDALPNTPNGVDLKVSLNYNYLKL